MTGRSIVEYFAEHEAYRCGYCGNTDTNYSHGMWAHAMTVQDYQDLIDRGWRRSGCYCYKPTMDQTCCPQYPIRCNALEFKLSKSHKKVIKRVNRFLNTGIRPSKSETKAETDENNETPKQVVPGIHKEVNSTAKSEASAFTDSERTCNERNESKANDLHEGKGRDCIAGNVAVGGAQSQPIQDESATQDVTRTRVKKSPRPGEGADPNKPECKKAKLMRQQRGLAKQTSTDDTPKKPKAINKEKSLEDFINEVNENAVHKLEIRTVRSSPASAEFERTLIESHAVYFKYQLAIHKDKPSKPVIKQFKRFLCDSPLEKIRLVESGSEEFHATSKESHAVFQKYQIAIHKDPPDECDLKGYTRFLVDSPLQTEESEGLAEGRGSFHQHYVLDGKIIAVGVLDILSNCTSSVYLYYDPDYHFLSLGTYSALRELAFTRYLHSVEPSIQYYYMGFYIHSCSKMRYKGNYEPSFLSCPQTYKWCPVPDAAVKLDANKYCRLAGAEDVDENGELSLDSVLVLHQRQAMPYMLYKVLKPSADDEQAVTQYASFVGKTCAERMLLYRQ